MELASERPVCAFDLGVAEPSKYTIDQTAKIAVSATVRGLQIANVGQIFVVGAGVFFNAGHVNFSSMAETVIPWGMAPAPVAHAQQVQRGARRSNVTPATAQTETSLLPSAG